MTYKNDEKILLMLDVDETLIHATDQELNQKTDFNAHPQNKVKSNTGFQPAPR